MEDGFRYFGDTMPRVSPELWERILACSSQVFFPAGSVIYLQDSATDGFFFIDRGTVRVYQVLEDGTDVTIEFFSDRRMFGEASAFSGDLSSPMAAAQTDVTARFIPTARAFSLLETDPEFAVFVVAGLVHKLRVATSQLGSVAGKRVSSRLTEALLSLDNYGVQRDAEGWYRISHAELASLISTTRANTTVLLNRLCAQGLVETRRRGIRILSPQGLRDFDGRED